MLNIDAGGVQSRRVLERWIAAEREGDRETRETPPAAA
jgi:hypothetical protein